MAKGLKYYFSFLSQQSGTHRVEFWFEGFTGDAIEIQGGQRPIILSEYNTSEDIFKPYRPFQAEIEVIGSSTTITMDDFVMDNDNDIEVKFYHSYPTRLCWQGFILQDNFQEVWEDTRHYIKLTATEGIGLLDNIEFGNGGVEVTGRITPLQAIEYSLQDSSLPLGQYTAFNNLFHSSMNDASTNFPLDQCKIDAKSFQIETTQYDSKLTVLNKINTAFSQTMFQYRGKWFFHRIEEWYTPLTDNLRGFSQGASTRSALNTRYDIEVGVDENVKPIAPEMLRYIMRRTKKDQVQYNFTQFDEIVTNQSFKRGDILSTNPSSTLRELDSWTYETGTFGSPTTPSGNNYGIKEEYVNGALRDAYAFFAIPATSGAFWIKSQEADVLQFETIDISFQVSYNPNLSNFPSGKVTTYPCWVFLDGASANYQLLNTGRWEQVAGTVPTKSIELEYDSAKEPKANEWNTVSLNSISIPDNGTLRFYFYAEGKSGMTGNELRIKNFDIKIKPAFQSIDGDVDIVGEVAYFEKVATLRNSIEFESFFDNGFSHQHKGTIYEDDGETITDNTWYRYRFPDELQNFKKEALIAQWEHNRFNRNKIDVTFWGLFPDGLDPIGLMNTIKFVDDDPDKVYAILNMKEMNFMENTWTATLIELYDTNKDEQETPTLSFNADVIDGTYNNQTYVPFTITSAADMTISGSYIFSYNGNESITITIACSVGGYINNASGGSVTLKLQKNGTDLNTQTITINSLPEPFNVDLTTASVTLNNNDSFNVLIDSNISEIELSTGSISFSYSSAVPFVYDPYVQKYINN